VPRQNSSGGKDRLGRVSKMGNGYLRRLLVVGAPSVTRRAETNNTRTGVWVRSLLERKPTRLVTVAIANKTYVTAYGDDEGWDAELGLKTEIVPLSKPFGLWEHNVFQGIVKMDGAPVPYAEVEVEFFNDAAATAPDELMITQTVKADQNGVFTYAPPPPTAGGASPRSTPPTIHCRGTARKRR
jgi:hypothetical protein